MDWEVSDFHFNVTEVVKYVDAVQAPGGGIYRGTINQYFMGQLLNSKTIKHFQPILVYSLA